MKKITILSCLAAIALGLSACSGNNNQSVKPTITESEGSNELFEGVSLTDFKLVYQKGINSISDATDSLNTKIEENLGTTLEKVAATVNYKESPFEIIIGNIERDSLNEYYNLNENEILIKTITTADTMKYIIAGGDADKTVFAIEELKRLFDEERVFDFETGFVYKNIDLKLNLNDIYLDKNELKDYKILVANNVDSNVKSAASILVNDLNKALGSNIKMKYSEFNANLDNVKNAIVIGNTGELSKKLTASLSSFTNHVKSTNINGGNHINIVGISNQELIYGIQALYRDLVRNGEIKLHKYISIKQESLERRDPCIVPYNGTYYLYSSTADGYYVQTSKDLKVWSDNKLIYGHSIDSGFEGIGDYWAPECHYYNGSFYLIPTYKSKRNNHRGCAILKSATPDGNFEMISDDHITPREWDAIDGTLYIEDNKPYMIFVHEWTSMPDRIGAMCYAELSQDLSHFVSEPVQMFRASDPKWTDQCVTDGPYMYKSTDGTLQMIWSNFAKENWDGYTIGISYSDNGKLNGNWIHEEKPLYDSSKDNIYKILNGGHGMIFKGFDNRLYLTCHSPNQVFDLYKTKVLFIPLIEDKGLLAFDVLK